MTFLLCRALQWSQSQTTCWAAQNSIPLSVEVKWKAVGHRPKALWMSFHGQMVFIVLIYSLCISKPALQNLITVRPLCLEKSCKRKANPETGQAARVHCTQTLS